MLYWKIALAFAAISYSAMMYSMLTEDDCDSGWDLANEILRRLGAAFVVGCMWPVCMVVAILLAVFCTVSKDD